MIYITLSLLIIVGLLIVLVNMFTLATIFSSRLLTKPANYPIIFFLITATVQGFIVVPAYCLKRLKFDRDLPWICDLFRFPYFVCGHLLTLNLVLVCIDRLIATKYPLRYPKIVTRASMIAAIIGETVVVIIVDLIPFGNNVHNEINANEVDYCVYIPWAEWSIAVVIGTIVFPLIFLTVSYAWIWLVALRLSNNQPQVSGRRKVSITRMISKNISKILELRATKTSALLIGVFILCWSPIAIYYLIENICGRCILELFSQSERPIVSFAVKVISFTSSILSPLAYCWRTREFQRELRKNLNKRRWRAARIALSFVQGRQKDSFKPNKLDADNDLKSNIPERFSVGNISASQASRSSSSRNGSLERKSSNEGQTQFHQFKERMSQISGKRRSSSNGSLKSEHFCRKTSTEVPKDLAINFIDKTVQEDGEKSYL